MAEKKFRFSDLAIDLKAQIVDQVGVAQPLRWNQYPDAELTSSRSPDPATSRTSAS